MIRTLVFVIAIISVAAAAESSKSPELKGTDNISVQVLSPEQIKLYRAENPDVVLTPLHRVETKAVIYYYLGRRVFGDYRVASSSKSFYWSWIGYTQLWISYPAYGTGKIITYVDVIVDQGTNSGNAYLYSGGIGRRYVSIIVEARSTSYLRHTSNIYGY